MPLGQPLSIRAHQQGHMGILRRRAIAERLVQQQLARGGIQQIIASEHIGNAHEGIVYSDGQLVAHDPVRSSDDEVASCSRRRGHAFRRSRP